MPQLLKASIVDILTDPEASQYDERLLSAAVRADLEDLLNTRQSVEPQTAGYPEIARSIIVYGLPDLSQYPIKTTHQLSHLQNVIAEVIRTHEPRLKNVRVTIVTDQSSASKDIRFHVDALLDMTPAPVVGFETVVKLHTGEAKVTTTGAAAA